MAKNRVAAFRKMVLRNLNINIFFNIKVEAMRNMNHFLKIHLKFACILYLITGWRFCLTVLLYLVCALQLTGDHSRVYPTPPLSHQKSERSCPYTGIECECDWLYSAINWWPVQGCFPYFLPKISWGRLQLTRDLNDGNSSRKWMDGSHLLSILVWQFQTNWTWWWLTAGAHFLVALPLCLSAEGEVGKYAKGNKRQILLFTSIVWSDFRSFESHKTIFWLSPREFNAHNYLLLTSCTNFFSCTICCAKCKYILCIMKLDHKLI